jgi:hypothetical protein
MIKYSKFRNVYNTPDSFDPIYTKIKEIDDKMVAFDERTEYIVKKMKKVGKKVDNNLCTNCCCFKT